MENKPNSVALLLSMGCRLVYNNMDMSAIDYAIYYKFPEAALAMVTHEKRYICLFTHTTCLQLKYFTHIYLAYKYILPVPLFN